MNDAEGMDLGAWWTGTIRPARRRTLLERFLLVVENLITMRGLAYAIAAIAAVGIMIAIASFPSERDAPAAKPATTTTTTASTDDASATPAVMSEPGSLTLSVPEMHCAVACYPRVKETLEAEASVTEVELAPQQEEGIIDNRQVVVRYEAGFDVHQALGLLEQEGFSESAVVQ